MNESTPAVEPVTVGRDGITVTKSLLLDEFPVPTVELEIRSARTDRTTVRLREYVPDGYSLESIGFHADYGSEYWTAYQDNRIEFEREVPAGETIRTIYGLRVTDDDEVQGFMGEPELVTVSGLGDDTSEEADVEQVVDRDRNDALRSMLGDDGEEEPATAEEADESTTSEIDDEPASTAAAEPDEATQTATDPDEADPSAADEAEPAEPTEESPAPEPAVTATPGSVAAALAEEIRADEVDPADREVIGEALGLDLSQSAEARLDHLHSRIEETLAYSEPVADFIDDGGPARLEDLEETVADLSSSIERLDAAEASVDELSATIDQVEAQIDELDADYDADIEDIEASLASLEHRLDTVDETLTDLDDRLDEATTAVSDLEQWRDQLGEMFSGRGGPD